MRIRNLSGVAVLRLSMAAGMLTSLAAVSQALTFDVTWGTNDSAGNFAFSADQQATIQGALDYLAGTYTNNVTVYLKIDNVTSGLGSSYTGLVGDTYENYRTALGATVTSANGIAGYNSLPVGTNPLNSSYGVFFATSTARALGYSAGADPGANEYLDSTDSNLYDSVLAFNGALCFTRTQGAQAGLYDLQAVAEHEIDEAMGGGGSGSGMGGFGASIGYVGALDLYRYSANGVRTNFASNSSPSDYFSLDNGATSIRGFNDGSNGGDYADWASGGTPHVQDAFGSPNTLINYSNEEVAMMESIGWNTQTRTVPEPASLAVLGLGLTALARRRKKA